MPRIELAPEISDDLSKREVDDSKAVTRYVTCITRIRELSQYLAGFGLTPYASLGMANKRQHTGIVV